MHDYLTKTYYSFKNLYVSLCVIVLQRYGTIEQNIL